MKMHHIEIAGRFDPAGSLLGRRLVRAHGTLEGEARYYLAAVVIFLAVLITNFALWAAVQPDVEAGHARETAVVVFRIGQALSVLLFVSLCVIGFRRRIRIVISDPDVIITQGDRKERMCKSAITSIEIVPATTYHRHYRRYAEVTSFVGAYTEEHVVMRAGERTVTIGVDGDAARRLVDLVEMPAVSVPADVRLAL